MSKRRRKPKSSKQRHRARTRRSQPEKSTHQAVLLQQSMKHHQAGRLEEARAGYCEILEMNPHHADAWHMLGMAMHQAGQHEASLDCLQHAISTAPTNPEMLSNLGVVCRALGDLDAAKTHLKEAARLQPNFVDGLNNLGVVTLEQRDYVEAEKYFRRVLELCPGHRHARSNLGNSLLEQRRHLEAQEYHEQVLREHPDDVAALNNLGSTLRARRKFAEAASVFQRAVTLDPNSAEVLINLGKALQALRQLDQAAACFRKLVRLRPDAASTYHNLGKVLNLAGHREDAIVCLEHALHLDPEYAFAHSSLGWTYLKLGQAADAIRCFQEALRLRPDLHETHSSLLFFMSCDPDVGPRKLFDEHRKWAAAHGVEKPISDHQNVDVLERKLRIGYVSPDFRAHAVAFYFEPTLANHDAKTVETFCYSEVYVEDDVTRRLRQHADHWRSTCGMSDVQVVEQILDDRIDVLVDLAGHTAHNRLKAFAHKPAPVQISWLGYPNTTGLETIDYRLTSEIQDPHDAESFHTEELVRLAYGTTCFRPPANTPAVGPLPADKNGFVTFGSLHRPEKISGPAFDLWATVLRGNPTARLLVFHTSLNDDSKKHVVDQLTARGVSSSRIELRNQAEGMDYLHTYNEIDIGLDVFPWNGGTTTRESLWMGVAVVALLGSRRSARGTAATLHQVGLDDLIASSPEDYLRITTELAGDLNQLKSLRASMRDRMLATVCDATRFTRELEANYRRMWHRWCHSRAQPDQGIASLCLPSST